MKKLLLTSLFLLISLTFFAQASFTSTGIAVQGIARKADNTAIILKNITLKFEFYYKNNNNQEITVGSIITKPVITDNFGVFSTIIDPNSANNSVFSNEKIWLKITNQEDSRILQDSQLMHVPYAISANNGVPTGSVMPFLGTVAPEGWVLCKGQNITSVAGSETLRTLLDSDSAPDLQGMFLRGAGTNDKTPVTTVLKEEQDDSNKKHRHYVNLKAKANTGGSEWIQISKKPWIGADLTMSPGSSGPYYTMQADKFTSGDYSLTTKKAGEHEHQIENYTNWDVSFDSTNENTVEETRPVNYGVNYIIKL